MIRGEYTGFVESCEDFPSGSESHHRPGCGGFRCGSGSGEESSVGTLCCDVTHSCFGSGFGYDYGCDFGYESENDRSSGCGGRPPSHECRRSLPKHTQPHAQLSVNHVYVAITRLDTILKNRLNIWFTKEI